MQRRLLYLKILDIDAKRNTDGKETQIFEKDINYELIRNRFNSFEIQKINYEMDQYFITSEQKIFDYVTPIIIEKSTSRTSDEEKI